MHFINTAKITKGMRTGEIPSEKQIIKNTLYIAWPSILESLCTTLAGVIDTIMVGAMGSSAIAAVGLTAQPKFLGLAIFLGLNIAVSSLVARRKGEENPKSANLILKMSIIITLILTVIISIVFVLIADPLISFVGSKPDTHQMAVDYFKIIMGGIVFTTISLVINAAQRGAGNTRITLITNLIANLVNVFFNYLLIGGNLGFPALGVSGAAIATVIGSIFGCALSIISVSKKGGFLSIKAFKGFIADKISIKSMMKISSSAFIEQLCMRIGFLMFVMVVANLGTTEMAAHQIGMNMMSISFSIGDGFSAAAITLIGQSLGRRRADMAKIYGNACQKIGLICAALIAFFYFMFGKEIFSIFLSGTKEDQVLNYGIIIMRILSIILFLQIEQVVQFGCLRGAGDTKFTAMVSLISVTCIRPGLSWLLCYPLGMGLIGAWIGTGCDQIVRFTLSFIRFKKGEWTKLKI